MRYLTMLIIFSLGLSSFCYAAKEGELAEGFVNPGYIAKPDWFKSSFLDLQEDLLEAGDDKKGVILYVHQDGCPYCEKLVKENFTEKDIVDRVKQSFDVVAINLWGDKELVDLAGNELTEKEYAKNKKIMFTPTLLFLDGSGKTIMRMNGYFPKSRFLNALNYVEGKHFNKENFNQYLARQSSTGEQKLTIADNFMKQPYLLPEQYRDSDKLLLVVFEETNCSACDEFHQDILKRPETIQAMKAYDIVQLDMHSSTPLMTPDGSKMTAKEWARKLNIQYAPSMVFFNKDNTEVFRTEGYLKTFHVVAAMDYVSKGIYLKQPEFQRHVQDVADTMREQGLEVDIMK